MSSRGLAWLLYSVVSFTAVGACSSDSGNSSGIPDACNPLGGQGCLLPWPSASYLAEAPTTWSGYQVNLPKEGMPVNTDGVVVDPVFLNRFDGFSPTGPMLAQFATGVSIANLPTFKDPAKSLAADSPIVLLNLDTGERAAFFAEIDMNTGDVTKRDLIIRPLQRLAEKAHYAVAIRKAVKASDGSDLPIPPAFQALVDGKDFGHPKFKAMKAAYPDIFAKLATAGVDKSDLVLAWDFRTASDASLRSDLTSMRTDALTAMGSNGSALSFAITTTKPNTTLSYKKYVGTYKSPTFLTDGEQDDSVIKRDADYAPVLNGMRDAHFAAIIPKCIETQPLPRPTVIFGHGLFGSAEEYLDDDFVAQLAEERCFIVIAGDFIGLTSRQLQLAPLAMNDMNRGIQISEKLGQSIIDFMALETAARNVMVHDPAFQRDSDHATLIDPSHTYYLGGSLGGIMGNTFMAYDPNITRGVLAVPGGVWSLLFERSNAWSLLMGAAQGAYEDPSYYQLNIAFLGVGMEPYDPITTAAHVIKDPLFDGQPAKTILMWYTLGDCLVTNITTEIVARTMGIQLLAPSVKSPWNLTPVPNLTENGVVVFDDHPTPLPPETNVPPAQDNGTHSGINRKPAALRFAEGFLIDQKLEPQCFVNSQPAPCDCATGACN